MPEEKHENNFVVVLLRDLLNSSNKYLYLSLSHIYIHIYIYDNTAYINPWGTTNIYVLTNKMTLGILYLITATKSEAYMYWITMAVIFTGFPFTVISQVSVTPMVQVVAPAHQRGICQGFASSINQIGGPGTLIHQLITINFLYGAVVSRPRVMSYFISSLSISLFV